MQEGNSIKLLSWVKIRIGEPLTAVQIDKHRVSFGSISGYVGYYDFEKKKTTYFQAINDELIRGVPIIIRQIYSQNNKLYISIGDKSIKVKNFGKDENDYHLNIVRTHSSIVCSHSMTMMYKLKVVIFCSSPTQKKQALSSELDIENKNLYEIDIAKGEIHNSREFHIPEVSVPFDYDGERILWMEYKQNQVKQFQYYDIAAKKVVPIISFDKKYHFLSFGKLIRNTLIFVQNNKNVRAYDMQKKIEKECLYSHSSSIIAFDIRDRESVNNFTIASVDFNGIYKEWRNGAVIKIIPLWQQPEVPKQIVHHKYLFDMGYPYYMKTTDDVIAITTDLGLCIFGM